MSYDPALLTHRAWLGMLQPVGVVVSPPALLAAQAVVDENLKGLRETFDDLLLPPRDEDGARAVSDALPLHIRDFARFAETLLGWSRESDLVPLAELPDALRVPLPEYETELAPTWAVAQSPDAVDPALGEAGRWLALVQVLPRGWDLDAPHGSPHDGRAWHASPQNRFERLLRETRVPLGLIFNETSLRVVYQPVGEASGHVTFPFALLAQTQGSLCLGALKLLLEADRLFTGTTSQRLPAILKASRKFQNEVSGRLAEQVLDALWELLQGFRSAHAASGDTLLRTLIERDRQKIYGGLLTVLLRLVFVLKAEDQGLLPGDPLYVENYGLRGLFESLREDLGRHPDAMDLRAHAWGRLIALFRLIHDGGAHGSVRLPPRYGELFDPDAYPFLEGREEGSLRQAGEVLRYPAVSDGVVVRVLAKLLVLDGEALSYRTLDVEQLGGVYEALMGFTVERVTGSAVALSPDDVVIDLDALLAVKRDRAKHLATAYGVKAEGELAKKLDAATTVDGLITALGRRISKRTPTKLPPGALVLQPTEERRRSGSHYTPRALTEPIVRTTLDPVLARLGERPTPAQILSLRVCDPAMGSGAFLVAVCRYLGDALVRAWGHHGRPAGDDAIPPDEDEILHARRLVAQRCLYGVDRNAFAVSLAKLSLWLVTMAKDHPFTFLDPLLRHGDSLVGLTRDQLRAFHWSVDAREVQLDLLLDRAMKQAVALREKIQEKASSDDTAAKSDLHREAEETLGDARLLGDLVVEAFFRADKDKAREARRKAHHAAVLAWQDGRLPRTELTGLAEGLREGDSNHRPVIPFHWPLAFPEVFARDNPGFDAIVGNPPFLGGTMISTAHGGEYLDWITTVTPEAGNRTDLVAYFFRRAFELIRHGGHAGLIATNTIVQGDTRTASLRWITKHNGLIIDAIRRLPWPGMAAVIVSRIVFARGESASAINLEGHPVSRISAWLVSGEGDDSPPSLSGNEGICYSGIKLYGQGFLFADSDPQCTPLSAMSSLPPEYTDQGIIREYLGGDELNASPTQKGDRFVIDFTNLSQEEAKAFPELFRIVEAKVKPEREKLSDPIGRSNWWRFFRPRTELYTKISHLDRCLCIARVSNAFAFCFVSPTIALNEKIFAFTADGHGFFATLQSRVHEVWTRFFSSTLKDDLQYTPSDCFETFPFPAGWETNAALEDLGRRYHARRAEIMVARNEGLTKTYNRFHDPDETDDDIGALRALHDAMDRAVLDAYGWTEIRPAPAFIAEHAAEEEDDGAEGRRKKKRAVRYRWPDADRDAVLAKLLALNAARAKEERKARALAAQLEKVAKKTKGKKG